jgi:hypothetical protein
MRISRFSTLFFALVISQSLTAYRGENVRTGEKQKVEFSIRESEQKVDVIIGGKVVTSYCWPDNIYKPVLYPLRTFSGTEITRGFPLRPREGERNDHLHQV